MNQTKQTYGTIAATVILIIILVVGITFSLRDMPQVLSSAGHNLLMLAGPLAALLVLLLRPQNSPLSHYGTRALQWSPTAWLVLGCAVVVALWFAIDRMWVGDDAFITFRYAENFAQGHGLVFNPGERVEGYTNFLWTVLVAAAIWLHIPAPEAAVVLNLVFMTGTLLVAFAIIRRVDPLPSGVGRSVPLTPLLLAMSYPFISFGTSGLETSMAAFFVVCGLWAWIARPDARGAFISGLCFILATLSRPDQALFYISMGATMIVAVLNGSRSQRIAGLKHLAAFALPFILLYLPYFVWRYAYYGYPFPNTYYAKMADQSYFSHGFLYLKTFLLAEGYWLLAPFFAVLLFVKHKERHLAQLTFFCGLSITLTTLYIVKVGGDFMHGRFFISLIPLFLICLELNAKQWLVNTFFTGEKNTAGFRASKLRAFSLVVFILGISVICLHPRASELKQFVGYSYIGDEPTWYPVTQFYPMVIDNANVQRGKVLGMAFKDFEKRPLYATLSVGMEGYYSKLPILDGYGLTDEHIAHQPFKGTRGRPGHERRMDAEYYGKRNPDLFLPKFMPVPFKEYIELQVLVINDVPVYMSRYQPEMLEQLKANPRLKLQYIPFPEFFDHYLTKRLPQLEVSQIDRDISFFKAYYFDHNPNPELLAKLTAARNARGAGPQ